MGKKKNAAGAPRAKKENAAAGPKGKGSAGRAPKIEASDTRGGLVKMRFANVQQAKETRGVSCEGGCYERDNDGTYLVKGEHVRTLTGLGLVQA